MKRTKLILGIFLGVLIQTLCQQYKVKEFKILAGIFILCLVLSVYGTIKKNREINQYKELAMEYKNQRDSIHMVLDSVTYNMNTYRNTLDRNGYPVDEMIKR